MGLLGWLKSIVKGPAGKAPSRRQKLPPPTEAEFQAALERLNQMVKPAIFGDISGETPSHTDQPASWWGGYFFGAEGEPLPVCQGTGRTMRPLVQIRTDELPDVPAFFSGVALCTIWIDFKALFADYDEPGTGFAIRTYSTFEGLVPIGPISRKRKDLPALPILWRAPVLEQPSWDDFASEIAADVAQAKHDVWFFESRYATETEMLYDTCPVKLGGWPNWIQDSRWPADAEFCLQVNSTDKGKLNIGDAGSLYIFRTPRGWAIRSDCY